MQSAGRPRQSAVGFQIYAKNRDLDNCLDLPKAESYFRAVISIV